MKSSSRPSLLYPLVSGLVLMCVLTAPSAPRAGELIRYRRSDGSVGFAGSDASLPPGAVILTRGKTTGSPHRIANTEPAPSLERLVADVRQRCRAQWGRDSDLFEHCLAGQTGAAFEYRDLLLAHRPGTQGRALVGRCRSNQDSRRTPDYEQLTKCVREAQRDFVAHRSGDPQSLYALEPGHPGAPREEAPRSVQRERLERLREDQQRAARELEIGRDRWRPRYTKADAALRKAAEKTRAIVSEMRRRGCRRNTLACGGLGPKLTKARQIEAEKRDYLTNGLMNECRRAGCQPGWLR